MNTEINIIDEINKIRLKSIKENLLLLNNKLILFRKLLESASGDTAIELQYRINKEILPAIKEFEDEQNDLTGN